jgi:hypothetical protein
MNLNTWTLLLLNIGVFGNICLGVLRWTRHSYGYSLLYFVCGTLAACGLWVFLRDPAHTPVPYSLTDASLRVAAVALTGVATAVFVHRLRRP